MSIVISGSTGIDMGNLPIDNTSNVESQGQNISPYGNKNLLINANGLVNQRAYVSGTATTTANQYTVDRWRVVTSGQNLTFSTTAGVTTFTAPEGGVEQVIENLDVLGGSYVLTVGGTATALVEESTNNVTYTTVTPTNGIYTITGGKYVRVRFSGGTFSLPQFERGSVATPFEQRPYGLELSLCRRYARDIGNNQVYGQIGNGFAISATTAIIEVDVEGMRTIPVISNTLTANQFELESSTRHTLSAISINGSATANTNKINLYCTTTGLTAGWAVGLRNNNNSTNKIILSSEL